MKKQLTPAEIKRLNHLAEQLLPILYRQPKEGDPSLKKAEAVLAEFMQLLGYPTDDDSTPPKK